ncbi:MULTISPECIES: glycoside hydrolase family 3 protein [Prochlorococcus]|uniref:beta-N-acetylhexosaminidase n=1 Tax=Prochlorococcus marinus (strain SARG / CCMP1375 / SS120) TaxID=167539 RepID=Q7VE80_PROMA|nr:MULTISPECIES: glycoside hydrolase family 3 N-terminal domain-containing protein [Prochlorococcus]AAP99179.1 Beta-glucosidase-related glycosidase [Prochlorococcus marinus subsp. marinus str. CCMP1375]KGG11552.1 Beta-glucosidase-related glycosidase [Prochlorococcus marinus str. LG]KGG18494.1 Beta-glucosidase-related glycosidase [Prochlorococcus marinus str. SS2]KGG22767.1 Beta-glucosidase-related glycosidase [Prochlorococcus marinus str. SS35]KGG32644.1 Beta-glucosidase-related glycosidase [P
MSSPLRKDLRQKVAQLVVVRASGHALDSQRKYPSWELSNSELKTLLEEGVGGVILHGGTVHEIKDRCNKLSTWSNQPILLCADVEEGVGQRFEGGSWMPPPMALGLRYLKNPKEALLLAQEYGKCIGAQARRCGLNWVLAPVCDVNSDPLNPVINMRAWGCNPNTVSALVCAFHRGLVSEGVLSCAKHFPGHGHTQVDSHLELPIVESDIARLEEIELIPFKALIEQGVNSVMSAHILFQAIDPTSLATFSEKILSGLLRDEIGFEGMVVTDALVMQAISHRYGSGEAAVMAFEAGADLILMPLEPVQAIDAIVEALLSGRIPFEKLEYSLERRNREMSKLNIISKNSIEEDYSFQIGEEFEQSKELSLVDNIIDISIETRNDSNFQYSPDLVNLIRIDDLLPCPYLSSSSPALRIPSQFGCKNVIYHPLGVSPWQDKPMEPLEIDRFNQGPFLLQLFVRGNPFRGNKDANEPWVEVVEQLQQKNILSGLVVYGSFYFWEKLLVVLKSSIPAAYSPGQMQAAQQKILDFLFKANKNQFTEKNNRVEFTN